MKKYIQTRIVIKLYSLFALVVTALFIYGCRKEIHPQAIVNQNDIGLEMKSWLNSQKFDSLTLIAINKYRNNIQWGDASSFVGDSSLTYNIVSVKPDSSAKFDNSSLALNEYLILTKNKGAVTESNFVSVVGNKNDIKSFPKAIVDFKREKQDSFTGTISLGSITKIFKESKKYALGKVIQRSILQPRGKSPGNIIQSVGGVVLHECNDWYWVTYDQYGNVVSAEYLYSDCYACNTNAIYDHTATLSLKTNCGDGTASGGGGQPSSSDISIDETEATGTPVGNPARINYLASLHCTYDQDGGAVVESVSGMAMTLVNGSYTRLDPDGTEDTWYTVLSGQTYSHSPYGFTTIQLTWRALKTARHTVKKPGSIAVTTVSQTTAGTTRTYSALIP